MPPVTTASPRRLLAVFSSYVGVAVLVVLGAVPVLPVLTGTPAHAAVTRTIELTADGPKPASLTAAVGDTIVFKNTDQTFIHQVDEASPNWAFSCPPLAPNQTCTAGKLAKPGEYLYEGVNLDDFTGKVVVPGAASPAPAPTRASSAPAPSRSPAAASSSSPAASPSPAGGSGSVGAPPLTGGFGSGGFPTLAPSPGGPAPAVAPVLPGEQASPAPQSTEQAVAVAPGRLPEPATARRYGLPAALAAVAAAGVGSLLVRLLLAHPAARARSGRLPGPAVTVD